MEPCQAQRLAVTNFEEQLRTISRGLSRYEHLRTQPTFAQQRRKTELQRRRTDLEREQRIARARLRDCEKELRRST